MKTTLVTGGAGFIGSHVIETVLESDQHRVICIDNFDDFYPESLKRENLRTLMNNPRFRLVEADIALLTKEKLKEISEGIVIDQIIHLAAKAGVRASILNPLAYYHTNVTGTLNLLEFAKEAGISHFIFASSSSVYGNNPNIPWKETEQNLQPISPYASSKIAAEQLGRVYAHLYDIRFTALRLFTVFGPRQRPDLAIHKFYDLLSRGKEITLYGAGSTARDYTYIEDIVSGITASLDFSGEEKFNIFNIGNGHAVTLLQMVETLEQLMNKKAVTRFISEQPGDVKQTSADISKAEKVLNYHPRTSLKEGIEKFLDWKKEES